MSDLFSPKTIRREKRKRNALLAAAVVGIGLLLGTSVYTAVNSAQSSQNQAEIISSLSTALTDQRTQFTDCMENSPENPIPGCEQPVAEDPDVIVSDPQTIAGPQGERGLQGPRGLQGVPGPQGLKGDTGEPGPVGQRGAAGVNGLPGLPGPAGRPGFDGSPGAPGEPGTDGLNGFNGVDGAPGPQGVPGVAGPQGPAGPEGPVGPAGPQGEPGAPGADGVSEERVREIVQEYLNSQPPVIINPPPIEEPALPIE